MTTIERCNRCYKPVEGSCEPFCICNEPVGENPDEMIRWEAIDFITKYLNHGSAFAKELKIAWTRYVRGIDAGRYPRD